MHIRVVVIVAKEIFSYCVSSSNVFLTLSLSLSHSREQTQIDLTRLIVSLSFPLIDFL